VTERPANVRAASILQRSHTGNVTNGNYNARRTIPQSRSEDNRITNRSYVGNHRAGMHHADDQTPAQRRSSRVGKHHAETTDDMTGRW
jgi:hypothetical protein